MNTSMITKLLNDLKYIFSQLKQNLYLFIKKLYIFYGEAFIMQNEMYFKTFNYILQKNGLNNLNENEIKNIINQNCCNIVKNIVNILNYYKAVRNPFYLDFYEIFNILSKITEKEINNYFCTYLFGLKKPKNTYVVNNDSHSNNNFKYNLRNIKVDNSLNNRKILEYQKNKIPAPFITTPTDKKYTLVLDLDNTLISHSNRNRINNNDIYNLRPGLLSFLNTLKPIYELISYTNESKEYSEQLLKEIESSRKYFDYNLYIEHNELIGNNLVKDISKIGRDMKKIIIVDKNYENIKSTPQNGILIKPYFGESSKNDTVLFELKKLLILFHKIGYEDIRVAIKNYESDIKYKITLDNNNK
jgi:TFIIF-interacting CTD phosphatase-like protein